MMTEWKEGSLIGNSVDLERTRTWRWPSSTLRLPREVPYEFAPAKKPRLGDVALVQVVSLGTPNFVENVGGCNMPIFPGTVILGTFAPRYAPAEFEGTIPESVEIGQEIELLNRGGSIGRVVSRNSQIGEPTKVRLLAFLKDKQGRYINTLDYGLEASPEPNTDLNNDRRLVLVTGTSMDSGKSSTAKAVTYALTAAGHRVVAGKVTGQAARRDILLMRAAGAAEIRDFVDFGYPSTYLLDEEEVVSLFWKLYNELHAKAGPGGYMVIEIADGIYQRETAMLLHNKQIQSQISHLLFSCGESLSAVAGILVLRSTFGLEATAISGAAANSRLGLKEVRQYLPDVPAFNNMVMDVPLISGLLTVPGPMESGEDIELPTEIPQPLEADSLSDTADIDLL